MRETGETGRRGHRSGNRTNPADRTRGPGSVRETLRADAIGSRYAEMIAIATEGQTVYLAGDVDALADEDMLVALAEEVDGVSAVVSRLRVAGLE